MWAHLAGLFPDSLADGALVDEGQARAVGPWRRWSS